MDTKNVAGPTYGGIGETMFYIENNSQVPTGVVSSTARKGKKWFDSLVVGEVFRLVNKDTGELISRAVCVRKEYVEYREVIQTAYDNHVAFEENAVRAYTPALVHQARLRQALHDAYGPICEDEMFSKIHLLPILDWAEGAVRKCYYAARWTPDRIVDTKLLWTHVRDAFGFKVGDTTLRLGPPTWDQRFTALKNAAIVARDGGELSVKMNRQDFIDLDARKCIDWLRMPGGVSQAPLFCGLIVDRLGE